MRYEICLQFHLIQQSYLEALLIQGLGLIVTVRDTMQARQNQRSTFRIHLTVIRPIPCFLCLAVMYGVFAAVSIQLWVQLEVASNEVLDQHQCRFAGRCHERCPDLLHQTRHYPSVTAVCIPARNIYDWLAGSAQHRVNSPILTCIGDFDKILQGTLTRRGYPAFSPILTTFAASVLHQAMNYFTINCALEVCVSTKLRYVVFAAVQNFRRELEVHHEHLAMIGDFRMAFVGYFRAIFHYRLQTEEDLRQANAFVVRHAASTMVSLDVLMTSFREAAANSIVVSKELVTTEKQKKKLLGINQTV